MTLCGRFRQRGRPAREGAPLPVPRTSCPPSEQEGSKNEWLSWFSPNGVAKPYKRFWFVRLSGGEALLHRLVGRNLRLNRADPPLHYGQPSPLRCVLLSPQGLTTLRDPQIPKAAWGKPQDPGRTGTPARNGCAVQKRGLNGAYKVSATHFYRLPRWSAEWRTTTPVPSSKEGN